MIKDFEIKSITQNSPFIDKPIITIIMTVNGETYNCTNYLEAFNTKESATLTLKPVIHTLLNLCYSHMEPKMKNLDDRLKKEMSKNPKTGRMELTKEIPSPVTKSKPKPKAKVTKKRPKY